MPTLVKENRHFDHPNRKIAACGAPARFCKNKKIKLSLIKIKDTAPNSRMGPARCLLVYYQSFGVSCARCASARLFKVGHFSVFEAFFRSILHPCGCGCSQNDGKWAGAKTRRRDVSAGGIMQRQCRRHVIRVEGRGNAAHPAQSGCAWPAPLAPS